MHVQGEESCDTTIHLQETALSFHYVGTTDQTQVIRPSGMQGFVNWGLFPFLLVVDELTGDGDLEKV